jgi:hypothetical protein
VIFANRYRDKLCLITLIFLRRSGRFPLSQGSLQTLEESYFSDPNHRPGTVLVTSRDDGLPPVLRERIIPAMTDHLED